MKNLLLLLLSNCFLVVAQAQATSIVDTLSYPGIIEFLDENANSDDPAMIVRLSQRAESFAEEEFGKNSNEYLDLVEFEATAWKELGDIPAAREAANRALSVAEAILDTTEIRFGDILMLQGDLHFVTGKLDSIRYFYRLAKQRFPKEHMGYNICLTQLGVVSLHLGDVATGLANFEESVSLTREKIAQLNAVPEADRDEPEIVNTQFALIAMMANLGFTYGETGHSQDALLLLEEGVERLLTLADKDHPYYAALTNIMTQIYTNIGQNDKAIALSRETVSLMSKPGKEHLRPQLGLYTQNLARQYKDNGQPDTALVYAQKALDLFAQDGEPVAKNIARAKLLLGEIYIDLQRYHDGVAVTREGLKGLKESIGADNVFYLDGELTLADVYTKQKQHGKALALISKVKEELANDYRNNFGFYGGILRRKAVSHEQLGEFVEAVAEYTESNQRAKREIDLNFYFLPESDQLTYVAYVAQMNSEILSFNYRHPDLTVGAEEALQSHLQLKGVVLGDRKKLMEELRSTDDDQLRAQFENWSATTKELAVEYAKNPADQVGVDSLVQAAYALETDLSRSSGAFRQAQEKVSWRNIQAQLTGGEVVVEFTHFPYQNGEEGATKKQYAYSAQIIKKGNGPPISVPLFFASELPRLRATKQLYAFPKETTKPNLHQLLYQPLAIHLAEASTVYFSPSGALHRINLGAIPITAKENMSDRFALHQIGSARDVSTLKKQQVERAETAVVFGGIHYSLAEEKPVSNEGMNARGLTDEERRVQLGGAYRSLRENEWPFLENTGREAEMVDASLHKASYSVVTHTGAKANEETFKQLGADEPSPRIVHLATHGFFFPDPEQFARKSESSNGFESAKHPLVRSGLIMAGGNQAWRGESTTGEDGILTAYEIAQVDLSNTELVVLSACDTGLGDINDNEGVFGLQRAFKLAGVKYVLMSLWSVKDEKTYEFMTKFYENLEGGVGIPLAYQRAQSSMHRKYALPFNPRNWAGFVLLE